MKHWIEMSKNEQAVPGPSQEDDFLLLPSRFLLSPIVVYAGPRLAGYPVVVRQTDSPVCFIQHSAFTAIKL